MTSLITEVYASSIPTEFSASVRAEQQFTLSDAPVTVELVVPPTGVPTSYLRLDFCDRPIIMELLSVVVKRSDGVQLWEWDGDPQRFELLVDCALTRFGGRHRLECSSADPHGVIRLPDQRPNVNLVLQMQVRAFPESVLDEQDATTEAPARDVSGFVEAGLHARTGRLSDKLRWDELDWSAVDDRLLAAVIRENNRLAGSLDEVARNLNRVLQGHSALQDGQSELASQQSESANRRAFADVAIQRALSDIDDHLRTQFSNLKLRDEALDAFQRQAVGVRIDSLGKTVMKAISDAGQLGELRAERSDLQERLRLSHDRIADLESQLRHREAEIHAMLTSRWWRLLRPFHAASRRLRSLAGMRGGDA